jgi:hypothetical protein
MAGFQNPYRGFASGFPKFSVSFYSIGSPSDGVFP